MAENEKVDPEFIAESSAWELGRHSYFFGNTDYKESSILSEFGWNIPAESSDCGGFADLDRIEADLAENRQDDYVSADSLAPMSDFETIAVQEKVSASPSSNRSVSSSSSEDRPEKSSTASGVSSSVAADTPSSGTAVKPKKKGQKRIRQARFAFVTKSEVDHLEDGYRWRKYGQKAVKNSPFPRSYYRCTNSKCTVKKRVERSCEDPTVVITTYEGQHCHHSIGFPTAFGRYSSQLYNYPRSSSSLPFDHPPQEINSAHNNITQLIQPHNHLAGESQTAQDPRLRRQPTINGEGLLGDIVPPEMRNG